MLERATSLEDARAKQVAAASAEFGNLAKHSADAQSEVISSCEAALKPTAYLRAAAGGIGRSCDILRASLPSDLPWIRTLLIVGEDGRVQCSTNNMYVGLDLSDRPYLKKARESRDFVLSDFLFARPTNNPMVMAAYPLSAISTETDSVVLASVNLDWMSKIMSNLGGRPGVSAVLVFSTGTAVAAPPDQASMIGHSLDTIPPLASNAQTAVGSDPGVRRPSFV